MLPTEAINRIRVLSERGMGSKAIAKSTGISRNTVRKYLSELRSSLRNFESQNEYGYKPCIKRRFQNAETLQPRNQKNSS